MSSTLSRSMVVAILLVTAMERVSAQDKSASEAAALVAFKAALEGNDVKALAAVTAGADGATLRKLAGPFARARAASDRLDKAIAEKGITFTNPFAASVTPFADVQFDVVEISRESDKVLARIRYGPRGRTQEEVVRVQNEEGGWRVTLPADLAKQTRSLAAAEQLERRTRGLDKLADVLETVAKEVSNGTLKSGNAVTLRLIKLVDEAQLPELLR